MVRQTACDRCGGDGRVAQTPCSDCGGRGRKARRTKLTVDIPAGIADEQRIRLTGRGHVGEGGGPSGDLYVLVRVREHEHLERDGDDLVFVADVPAIDAALGTTVDVETLDGVEPVKIEPGTQPGAEIRLRGKGMPSLRHRGRGDQRVIVNVLVPRRLSKPQRELLEELRGTLSEENFREEGSSFFARRRRR
jgi:molecular chaperone DnaJ